MEFSTLGFDPCPPFFLLEAQNIFKKQFFPHQMLSDPPLKWKNRLSFNFFKPFPKEKFFLHRPHLQYRKSMELIYFSFIIIFRLSRSIESDFPFASISICLAPHDVLEKIFSYRGKRSSGK